MMRKNKTGFSAPKEKLLAPHSIEAEQGVLGCCLLSPMECIDEAGEVLTDATAFYDLRHAQIWKTLVRLSHRVGDASGGIDLITVQQELKNNGELDQVGGLPYLTSLPDTVPSAANLAYYLDIVKEKWQMRQLYLTCTEIASRVYNHDGDPQALLDEAERDLIAALETRVKTTAKRASEVVQDVVTNVIEKFKRGYKFNLGPSFGFNYLDNVIPGMEPGQFIVLAARPSTGKSAMMMQVAEHVAGDLKLPVGVFTMEMSNRAIGKRQIFQRAKADLQKFTNGFLEEDSMPELVKAARDIADMPIYYEDTGGLSVQELSIKARRLVRKHGVKVIFIDYLGLLHSRTARNQFSRADEIGQVSMTIKALAKELGIPMFVVVQMNREFEKEFGRRPKLSDLRDTGQLEQDADIVMFLWNPDVSKDKWQDRLVTMFSKLRVPDDWKRWNEGKGLDGKWYGTWKKYLRIVTCTVAKQREGPSNEDCAMIFIKPWCRLVDAYTPPREPAIEPEEKQEG